MTKTGTVSFYTVFVCVFSLLMLILLLVTELYLSHPGLQDVMLGLNDEFQLWMCYSIAEIR